MRSTLFASCLLTLTCGFVGCDEGKKEETAPATTPTVTPAPAEKGAMGGPAPAGETKPEGAAPTTPAPEPK